MTFFTRIFLLLLAVAPLCPGTYAQSYSPTIVRDSFGTAHVFGETDAEAAFGLAWANCEDAFDIVQEALITARAMRGRWKGNEGAPFDFFVQSLARMAGQRTSGRSHARSPVSTVICQSGRNAAMRGR